MTTGAGHRIRACDALALLVAAGILVATLGTRAAFAQPLALRRPYDPVTVAMHRLPDLLGADPSQYRLYALRAGAPTPIPFQIDARDATGRHDCTGVHTGVGDRADEHGELVFMAADLGERAAAGAFEDIEPPPIELEVTDPVHGDRGWAYLVHAPAAPALADRPYATYDPQRDTVRAATYHVRYPPGSNFLADLAVTTGLDRPGRPLVQRMSLLIQPTFSLLLTTWRPRLTEASFTTEIQGLRNGPVRAILRARQSLDLGRLLPDAPAGDVETFYYRNAIVNPSTFRISGLALRLLRDFRFEGLAVLDDTTRGSRYVDAAHPDGVALADLAPGAITTTDPAWFVIDGPAGTYLHVLTIPGTWRAWGIARATLLRETDGSRAVGFGLQNMTQLTAPGAYDLLTAMIVLDRPYRPGDEQQALAMLDHPLSVELRSVVDRLARRR